MTDQMFNTMHKKASNEPKRTRNGRGGVDLLHLISYNNRNKR